MTTAEQNSRIPRTSQSSGRGNLLKNLALLSMLAIATILLIAGSQLATSVLAHGNIDQQNEATGSQPTIDFMEPAGQEFTPSQTPMVAADVELARANFAGDANITVRVRDATIDGTILGEVTQIVPETLVGEEWIHFDLPTPVPLAPGQIYVLEVETDNATHAWVQAGGGDPYPGGDAIRNGSVSPTVDFSFRTYSQEGTPTPTPTATPTEIAQPTGTPTPEPTATPTATPSPTEAPLALPPTGAEPNSDPSSSSLLAIAAGSALLITAGGLYMRNGLRPKR